MPDTAGPAAGGILGFQGGIVVTGHPGKDPGFLEEEFLHPVEGLCLFRCQPAPFLPLAELLFLAGSYTGCILVTSDRASLWHPAAACKYGVDSGYLDIQ